MTLPVDTGSLRLVADGRTSALLGPDGEVVWWCAPDLDSPPVLWSLLDPAGARACWPGALSADAGGVVGSPCQSTLLRLGSVRLACLDGFVPGADGVPALVRLVRSLDGPCEVVHELSAGGFDAPRAAWELTPDGARSTTVAVRTTGSSRVDGPLLRTVLQVDERWSALVVSTGSPPDPAPDALHARLHALRVRAEQQVSGASLPGRWDNRLRDALRVLQACTFDGTGAVVASPTTSLPEAPGEDRQFDYRYTWLRDASLAVSVASLLGRTGPARRFLAFAREAVDVDDPLATRPLLTVHGGPVPEEREVPGVAGWAGSQPVRVGNGAGTQRQYDALGLLVEAVSVHVQTGGRLDRDTWRTVVRIGDAVAREVLSGEHPVASGIWELREPQRLVVDDIGRWLALDRAVWVARLLRPWHRRGRWLEARDRVRDRVLSVMGEDGSLPQSYDAEQRVPDASALGAAVFGMVHGPAADRLVDWHLDRLGAGALVHRYPPAAPGEPADDGFSGREGSFLPMAFWAVSALAATGRVPEAERRMADLLQQLPRLLPEEVEPGTGRSLGNVPLLWSHMELARAAYVLEAARLQRRWGTTGQSVWRLARYVRLRLGNDRTAG